MRFSWVRRRRMVSVAAAWVAACVGLAVVLGLVPGPAASAAPDAAAPGPADAVAPTVVGPDADAGEASRKARASGRRVEVPGAKRPDRRVFANPDGSWTAEVSSGPERAKDASGAWRPLDLSLVERAGRVMPRIAVERVSFSPGGDRVLATWRVAGELVEWRWPESLPAPELAGAKATYPGVAAGGAGDLVAEATPAGFEYSVVLQEAPGAGEAAEDDAAEDGGADGGSGAGVPTAPEFVVDVVADGLSVTESDSGGLEFVDASGAVVAGAPLPMMWDAAAEADAKSSGDGAVEEAEPVAVSVEPVPGSAAAGGRVTLSPDPGWLADPEREYPVTVDPSWRAGLTGDTWLSTAFPDWSRTGHEDLRVGTWDGGGRKFRSWLKFNIAQVKGTQIQRARLRMRNYWSNCNTHPIAVRAVREAWTGSGLTWSNQPTTRSWQEASNNAAHGGECPGGVDNVWWDVTGITARWSDNRWENHGLRVKANDETKNRSWRKYRSANWKNEWARPRLVIDYNTAPKSAFAAADQPVRGDL